MRTLMLIISVIAVVLWINHTATAQNFAIEFFADSGDSAMAPDSDSLDIDGKELTMEAWIFTTGPQNGDGIIINKENSYECAIRAGDQLMFAVRAGAWDWWGGGKPTMQEWHHVAVTYDGKITQGWIDGVAAPGASNINSGPIVPQDVDSPFQVGRRVCCGGTPFKGIIDEVRISDVVRYTGDFKVPTSEFAPDENTRLLWHFNEGKGDEIEDASGNENTGERIGKAAWVEGAPIGPAPVEPGGKLTTMWGRMKAVL